MLGLPKDPMMLFSVINAHCATLTPRSTLYATTST